MVCSNCKQAGHNKRSCTTKLKISCEEDKMKKQKKEDKYTQEILSQQYKSHMSYVLQIKETSALIGLKLRLPSIPEYISENIIKYIIQFKLGDKTTSWNCEKGDLFSEIEGIQECKCFTSDGPLSFTPTSEWDVIYFLDARKWLSNHFVLYKSELRRTSDEWKNIKMNKKQSFDEQCKQGRRPRICWETLTPQLSSYITKIYEGTFEDIFIPLEEEA